MNILTIIVLLIFAIFMLKGYRKGFIKSLASIISLVVSLLLVSFVTPYVAEFLQTQTPIYAYVNKRCRETFSISEETIEKETAGKKESESAKTAEISSKDEIEIIDNLPLPPILKTMLKNNNTEKMYKELAVKSFNDYVPTFMTGLIMNIISFVITWILVASFIWLAIMTLDIIANLPIIHGINQILGIGLGFVQALVIVWLIFLAITIFSNTTAGKELLQMISDSVILRKLYDTNMILNFLQNMVKGI